MIAGKHVWYIFESVSLVMVDKNENVIGMKM